MSPIILMQLYPLLRFHAILIWDLQLSKTIADQNGNIIKTCAILSFKSELQKNCTLIYEPVTITESSLEESPMD